MVSRDRMDRRELRIRYILVVATMFPALIAIFVLRYYPLNETRMTEIRPNSNAGAEQFDLR
jgi:hypothetical protein